MASNWQFHDTTILWIVFTLIEIPLMIGSLSSTDLCLSKLCSGCMAGSLSCQEGGLTRLPDELAKDIQSMILIGHRFEDSSLGRDNFTAYPRQTKVLQRITLRNCGIERIQPGSLEPIQSLTQLDLSQNRISFIEAGTFAGLRLDYLRLDENHRLHLAPGAFRDASIVSLSMNQCGMESLTYEDLAPLLTHHVLTTLHLSGNRLITLESRLEPVFLELQSLSLDQNPFVCDCRLSWLAEVLQRRQIRRKSRALKQDGTLGQDAPLDNDLPRPTCRAPDRLAGRPLETLTADDFFCGLPQLRSLEVDIEQTKAVTGDQSDIHNQPLAVTLRCQVKGSPEMKLAWYRRSTFDSAVASQLGLYSGLGQLSKLATSRPISSDVAEIRLIQPTALVSSNRETLPSAQSNPFEQLICVASDSSGNVSAEVRLRWPALETTSDGARLILEHRKEDTSVQIGRKKLTEPVKSEKQGVDGSHSWQKSTQQLDPDVRSNWYVLTGEDPSGFWLQKQFSALQMIGAVVGTFTFTLLLFIVGCCLLKAHRLHRTCLRSKILLHHASSYQHSSPTSKYSAPPLYSSPAIPQSHVSAIYPSTMSTAAMNTSLGTSLSLAQLSYQFPTISAMPSNGTVPGGELKRLPYATTYEPVTTAEQPTQNTYSDTQTYDLPQFPINLTPPSAPLPAVPSTSLPVSVNKTLDSRAPYYVSTVPCNQSCHPASMYVPNMDTIPTAFTMAATLNRLQHPGPSVQGQLHCNPAGAFGQTQQQLT